MSWFNSLSIRWKLQLSFFLVTMVTIVFVRWGGYQELTKLIEIAKINNVSNEVIEQLDARLSTYATDALWQSAIEFAVLFMVISVLSKYFVGPIEILRNALKDIEQIQ